jgi:hypothetical protein
VFELAEKRKVRAGERFPPFFVLFFVLSIGN